eukprot:CAMPEP_0172211238 /NCGR_PEP_ID=MMETSP1050-20130122/36286_1 /TAXON_ID=233186 /ORGANISM="Cryptomonas curvata, Strain CCAP979/52" /LENGTH=226 /DNA_ID=CAMNT_0012891657 /DNA_START=87 /DNA_END=765 /DNA_ORIENTATION=-
MSTSPKSSKTLRQNSSQEDRSELHPGRTLCYYWKKEHRAQLEKMVEDNRIRYNTGLEIHVEYCTAQRPTMSLRASYDGCNSTKEAIDKARSNEPEINRYQKNYDSLESEVLDSLAKASTGEDMWAVTVYPNNAARALGPRHRRSSAAAAGSFEITLMWHDARESSLKEVVLFSKLNTLKFPNPPDVVAFLNSVLAPARMTAFKVVVRNAATGDGQRGAMVRATDRM